MCENKELKFGSGNRTSKHHGKLTLLLGLLFVIGSCLLICGCSSESVDDQFISSLEKGLSARWAKMDDTDESKSYYEGVVNAELDEVSKYSEESFEDEDLGKLAKEYIELLNSSLKTLDYYGNDSKLVSEWNKVKDDRVACLVKINEIKPLEFSSDSDQEEWESLLSEGKVVQSIRKIMKAAKFKVTEDDGYGKTCVAMIENTSDEEFDYFDLEYKLLDKDGNTLESSYASTSNWKPGEKAKFEFWTDENFKEIKVTSCEYNY